MDLYLIRHFQANSSKQGAFYGSTDMELAPQAIENKRGKTLDFPSDDLKLYCSPLMRCRQTATLLLPHRDFTFLKEAREVDFGDWEGHTFDEISQSHSELVNEWMNNKDFCFPGGESLPDFNRRIGKLAKLLAGDYSSNVMLVAHGGVIRHLICHFLGLSPNQSLLFQVNTGSITRLKIFDNGKGVLVF